MSSQIEWACNAACGVKAYNGADQTWVHTQGLLNATSQWVQVDADCVECLAYLLDGYQFWGISGAQAQQIQQLINSHQQQPLVCLVNGTVLGTT